MRENFSNLVKEIDMQVQEAQRVPNNMDAKRPIHIIIKIPKVKDKESEKKLLQEGWQMWGVMGRIGEEVTGLRIPYK